MLLEDIPKVVFSTELRAQFEALAVRMDRAPPVMVFRGLSAGGRREGVGEWVSGVRMAVSVDEKRGYSSGRFKGGVRRLSARVRENWGRFL